MAQPDLASSTPSSVWNSINPSVRQSLVAEDLEASRGVATVLLGVVTFGVLLGVTAVLIICL